MFKVGDKIRIKKSCWHAISRGETGEVVLEDSSSFKIKMDNPGEFINLFVSKTDVELVDKIHLCLGVVLCKECLKDVRRSVLL